MMPLSQQYIAVIDDTPQHDDFVDYFTNLNCQVVQQPDFFHLDKQIQLPVAFLVNWIFIQENPFIIEDTYQNYALPLIIISDVIEEDYCTRALDAGADDFLLKPFRPEELHARITAITRRIDRANETIESKTEVILFDDWRLYPASRQVFNNKNEELKLSASEYDLLITFIQHPQCVLSREFLLRAIRDRDLNLFDRRIDVQVGRLRQKIEVDVQNPVLIKTIRNGGYLFTERGLLQIESEEG